MGWSAYHEAGHIVAQWVLDLQPQHASILASEGARSRSAHGLDLSALFDGRRALPESEDLGEGNGTIDFSGKDERREVVERIVMSWFAGPIAEELAADDDPSPDGPDYERAIDLALRLGGRSKETNAFVVWLFARAESLIRSRWVRVEMIADALSENETLDRSRIVTIMTMKPHDPHPKYDFWPGRSVSGKPFEDLLLRQEAMVEIDVIHGCLGEAGALIRYVIDELEKNLVAGNSNLAGTLERVKRKYLREANYRLSNLEERFKT